MPLELSEHQQQAIDAKNAEPLRLVDPRTAERFVLLRAEQFDRIQALVEEAQNKAKQAAWIEEATETRRRWAAENPY